MILSPYFEAVLALVGVDFPVDRFDRVHGELFHVFEKLFLEGHAISLAKFEELHKGDLVPILKFAIALAVFLDRVVCQVDEEVVQIFCVELG